MLKMVDNAEMIYDNSVFSSSVDHGVAERMLDVDPEDKASRSSCNCWAALGTPLTSLCLSFPI